TAGRLASSFVENRGQAHPSVRFYGGSTLGRVSLTERGVVFTLGGGLARVALDFVGADLGVRPVGRRPVASKVSVFRGAPGDWKTGVASYAEVCYPDLWPGVDLVLRSGEGSLLKYEFVVAPGADPQRIRLAYRQADWVELAATGEIEVHTAAGLLREKAP